MAEPNTKIGEREDVGHTNSMPDELMRFIQRDTYSLLIKGYAGTGKTTLALTILRALGSRDNFFYISTRISPKQLFQYYPWLAKFIEQAPKPLSTSNGAADHTVLPTFEDARLDEPESLFERITNQLMDIKSPIIIIDSWDAIASFMDKEARLNNERVLQTWRERAGAKLIFISEHPDDTTLDFLVDGIVELKQSNYENVRVREIFLLKLRGVRIDRSSYIFTLENSSFRSFAPYRPIKFRFEPGRRSGRRDPITVTNSNHVKSSYEVLDDALGGGFPRMGVTLLELGSHVNTGVAIAFLGGLVSNFVSNGHPVLFQPFDWVDPRGVMDYLGPILPAGKKNLFKILWSRKLNGLSKNVIVPQQKVTPILSAVTNMKQRYRGKLLLNIMGTDIMQKSHDVTKDFRIALEDFMSAARSADISIAVISRSQKEILEYLSEVSEVHLRLLMINDTLFLQPLVPASTLYALKFDKHQIVLEPVV
ncbi:MAG: AAA family ATPase [Nitrososphaera sp.]|nr:AAA family ATPase [Nitrososphaera sp.]